MLPDPRLCLYNGGLWCVQPLVSGISSSFAVVARDRRSFASHPNMSVSDIFWEGIAFLQEIWYLFPTKATLSFFPW